jgi:hypothetical protein
VIVWEHEDPLVAADRVEHVVRRRIRQCSGSSSQSDS